MALVRELCSERAGKFVQVIGSAVSDPGVERSGGSALAGALRGGKPALEISIEPWRLDIDALRGGEQVLEAEVDPDAPRDWLRGLPTSLYAHYRVEVPPAAGVLREAPRAYPVLGEVVAIPEADVLTHLKGTQPRL